MSVGYKILDVLDKDNYSKYLILHITEEIWRAIVLSGEPLC